MTTSDGNDDRITRLEDIVKAMIDGNPAFVRPGGMRTPRDTMEVQMAFSKAIAAEREAE